MVLEKIPAFKNDRKVFFASNLFVGSKLNQSPLTYYLLYPYIPNVYAAT